LRGGQLDLAEAGERLTERFLLQVAQGAGHKAR
jgi:hypothetical protein